MGILVLSARSWCSVIALLATMSTGCDEEPEPYESLRVVVDTDATVPDDLDAFTLVVERNGVNLFNESYDAEALGALPDSMVIVNGSPNNDSPEKQMTSVPAITVTVVGFLGGDARVSRAAELRFNRGQRQLPMPMCASCLDVDCEAGETCKLGGCVDPFIGSIADLPEESEPLADALAECGP